MLKLRFCQTVIVLYTASFINSSTVTHDSYPQILSEKKPVFSQQSVEDHDLPNESLGFIIMTLRLTAGTIHPEMSGFEP